MDLIHNKIVYKEYEFTYKELIDDNALTKEDDRLEALGIDNSDDELARSIADKSELDDLGNSILMNDLLSYIFKIMDKPQFIKDYFFTNDLIKPIAPKILKPNKAKAKIDGMVELPMLYALFLHSLE